MIIDDFGHHPTAIRETAQALRARFVQPGARLWALFEPRSNTTKRKVFQEELATALATADGVLLSEIFEAHKVPADDRLENVIVAAAGRQAGVDIPDQILGKGGDDAHRRLFVLQEEMRGNRRYAAIARPQHRGREKPRQVVRDPDGRPLVSERPMPPSGCEDV